jgi:hypothetical protein
MSDIDWEPVAKALSGEIKRLEGRTYEGVNLWLHVPKDDYVTPDNVCKHCYADPDECGEYPECCYNGWVKAGEHHE